ncbi:MAG: flagellar biosynthetic protein FliR [Clostridia bacterium]|nr:flagellar biosynthetic protein FliR [Clostridia bacterium]
MELTVGSFAGWAGYMLLIFLRVISTFVLSPLFGKHMPNIAKIVFSILLSYIIISVFPPQNTLVLGTVLEFAVVCIKEVSLGLILSVMVVMFISCVYAAGSIIDMQLGFSFAQLYDPQMNAQAPLSGNFLNLVLVVLFFATDGHHILIRIIYNTFVQIPPGAVNFNGELIKVIVQVFALSFTLSIRIAMPVLAVSLVVEVLLGVIFKAIPQMNFFVIGFPVKIFIGLIVMMAFIPVFVNMSDYIFQDMFSAIQKIFEEMGGVP